MKKLLFVCFSLFTFFSNSPCALATTPPSAAVSDIDLLNFRIGVLALLTAGENAFTGQVSWNPLLRVDDKIQIGPAIGLSVYQQNNKSRFSVLEATFNASYLLGEHYGVELAAGAQTWFSTSESVGVTVGAKYLHAFHSPLFGASSLSFINKWYAGYSLVFQTKTYHILSLGLGLSF